ncbi:hypothetical protein [uncultured Kordia sp.]|uniref:hypothetical protein n=1 Tax=uncultured Kordia sp. TaxID=507699 RepID=UPI002636774B|nr:hypothetical protein [uncultured Kordia sp.]
MKKRNLKSLRLNKNTVSSLKSENVKGGATQSCFIDVDTNCAKSVGCNFTVTCPTNACPTDTCPTNTCPPPTAFTCILSISCPANGIC